MPSRRELANAIRALSMDAVQKAKSGHPGAPMGMADIAEVLWNDHLRHNPANPGWANRDRFVLSNGHGSMLIYSLLHLTGYGLSIEDLKNFRQWHSKTPGHPEVLDTPGVETTTGPLGQGITNGVGMALAEKILAAQFNQPDHEIIDHRTWVFLGDGCLMEGISHEACSLAGTLQLGKLVAFYDDNGISIDGEVHGWFTDDTTKRFEAYGWQVIAGVDGHDANAISAAIAQAVKETGKPTLIRCKTIIGFGSPNKQGKEECHGSPLGEAEVALAREQLGWPHAPFVIPPDISAAWDAKTKGAQAELAWHAQFLAYKTAHPELAAELNRRLHNTLPAEWAQQAQAFVDDCQQKMATVSTRKASQLSLEAFGPLLPELLGGSADLAGSNLTLWKGAKGVSGSDASGNYLYYGVREFGMSAIMNGIALHGGFIPYGGTFLIFMEYARNAVRMAALMQTRSIFVYTHDSVGLGEDGPTHQPIEQLTSLRTTPGLDTWRPCDMTESAAAWKHAIEKHNGPSALVFSRQDLPHQARDSAQLAAINQGGYVLRDCAGAPHAIIIATGSEVQLAMAAAELLAPLRIRVVSMPCTELFDAQPASYRDVVLPPSVKKRVAIEAGHGDFWFKYVGLDGAIISIDRFGASAPGNVVLEKLGISTDNLVAQLQTLLA